MWLEGNALGSRSDQRLGRGKGGWWEFAQIIKKGVLNRALKAETNLALWKK